MSSNIHSYFIRPRTFNLLKVVYAMGNTIEGNFLYVRAAYNRPKGPYLFMKYQSTRIVYLNKPISLNKNFQRDLKKGEQLGITVNRDLDIDFLSYFKSYNTFLTQRNFAKRKLIYKWFVQILRSSYVFSARISDKQLYTIVVLNCGEYSRYHFGWNWAESTYQASKVIHSYAMNFLLETGVSIYDLGGLSNNGDGRDKFKHSIGGENINTYNYFKLC